MGCMFILLSLNYICIYVIIFIMGSYILKELPLMSQFRNFISNFRVGQANVPAIVGKTPPFQA